MKFCTTGLTGCHVHAGNVRLLLCWPALGLFALVALSIQKFGVWRLLQEKKVGGLAWEASCLYLDCLRS